VKPGTDDKCAHAMDKLLATVGDSDDPLIELWQTIGSRTFMQVLDILGGPSGMQTYVPTPQNFLAKHKRNIRDPDIRRRFKSGKNVHALAVEYGVTKTRIRQIANAQSSHTATEHRA